MGDGERLRQARQARGLSQIMVAQRAGLTPQYYNDIERGRRSPPDATYAALCGVLGLASDRPAALVADYRQRIDRALRLIGEHGTVAGARHKQWVIDQVARLLATEEEYRAAFGEGTDWDGGIAP